MTTENTLLKESSEVKEYETAIWQAEKEGMGLQIEKLKKEIELRSIENEKMEKKKEQFRSTLAKITGKELPENAPGDYPIGTRAEVAEAWDVVYGIPGALIRSAHDFQKYSITRARPEIKKAIPEGSALDCLRDIPRIFEEEEGKTIKVIERLRSENSLERAEELIREYMSDNTRRAHQGDLIYWQAWLGGGGFSFDFPITEKEVTAFIIQHLEGLPHDLDIRLVAQGYKQNLGPHKLSTVKRRVGSLSVFLNQEKLTNPCHSTTIHLLFQKLTKKYGSKRSRGKAITRDIMEDILETCENKLIDIRDKAVLLFAWSSGGRRRSEVVEASIENLSVQEDGYVYTLVKSKTDQEGKGLDVPIKGKAAKMLNQWLKASGVVEGAIFRSVSKGGKIGKALSGIDVYRIVRRRLKAAGYDERQYGAHSLRSGFVTESGRRGKPLGDVMAMTGHRSVNTAMGYYQSGSVINNSAADLMG